MLIFVIVHAKLTGDISGMRTQIRHWICDTVFWSNVSVIIIVLSWKLRSDRVIKHICHILFILTLLDALLFHFCFAFITSPKSKMAAKYWDIYDIIWPYMNLELTITTTFWRIINLAISWKVTTYFTFLIPMSIQ